MKPLIQRRRCWLFLFVVVACTMLAVTVFWLSRPRVTISQATCEKIMPGMTRGEVLALIGGPPGDYTTGLTLWVEGKAIVPDHLSESWHCDTGEISVYFDDAGKVHTATFDRMVRVEFGHSGILDRFRNWLGW